MKVCSRCRTPKPVEAFGRRSDAPDGVNPRCKACNVEAVRLSRQAHPETYAAWEAANRVIRLAQKRESARRARRRRQEAS